MRPLRLLAHMEGCLMKYQNKNIYSTLKFVVPVGQSGDCYDRYLVRMEEMRQSLVILEEVIN